MAKYSAIILAAGSGSRMGSKIAKQYLPLEGKPLVYYALRAFADSMVDELILVVASGEIEYCKTQIIDKYHIDKVSHIVEGGRERYDSVYAGLQKVSGDYVLIHDGARAFVDEAIITRAMEAVNQYQACCVGMPVKDTIKIVDDKNYASETPSRDTLWMVQTPQCFATDLIRNAYEKILQRTDVAVTDDSMVVEQMTDVKVKLISGSYDNIKVTTPEDMVLGTAILQQRRDKNES